jgi:hypothetical protein
MDLTEDVRWAPARAAPIVDAARRRDAVARAAVHKAVEWFLIHSEPLPNLLRDYVLELLFGRVGAPKKRGRSPHGHYLRDGLIKLAAEAVTQHGFKMTRNPATSAPSACSIVSEVLAEYGVHMVEKNVEAIASPRKTRPK